MHLICSIHNLASEEQQPIKTEILTYFLLRLKQRFKTRMKVSLLDLKKRKFSSCFVASVFQWSRRDWLQRVYECLLKWSPGIRFCSHPILTALPKFCTLYFFIWIHLSRHGHKLFSITITRSVRTLSTVLFYRLSDGWLHWTSSTDDHITAPPTTLS